MPYTYKSLAFLWLIILALFIVSASGVARGPWFALLVAVAIAAPALVLRNSVDMAAPTSPERSSIVVEEGASSPTEVSGVDLLRWENEGGAGRAPGRASLPGPAPAAS